MVGPMKKSPFYFPIERGLYEIAPGLRPLGFDFGNGHFDQNVFQITADFSKYRQNKLDCRDERLTKYFCQKNLSEERTYALSKFIIEKLLNEYPHLFFFEHNILSCFHTGDKLCFDKDYKLLSFSSKEIINTPVLHSIDALSLQIQEDLALVCNDYKIINGVKDAESVEDHLALLHLCSASHWAAEDKIGLNFKDLHQPIPGIEKVNRISKKLMELIIYKGPFVRFIWSFVTDNRLNHHPIAPSNYDQTIWTGRHFDESQDVPFYFRVERQITYGLPEVDASLFTIGVFFISGHEIRAQVELRQQLILALKSMTLKSREYKGVAKCFDKFVAWLSS